MDSEIKKLITLNDELIKKMDISLPLIVASLNKTKFKYTTKALLSFIPKSGYLNSAILQSCDSNNLYSASVLFRSLIEHSFRHLYIYTRALKDDSDSVGKAYYHVLKSKEDLDSFVKVNNYRRVIYPEQPIWSTKGEQNKLINDKSKEFDIFSIFLYLVKDDIQTSKDTGEYIQGYLLKRLVQYTELSSNIHGGPFAEVVHRKIQENKSHLNDVLCQFAADSFDLYKNVIQTTYLFASSVDDTTKQYYDEFKD